MGAVQDVTCEICKERILAEQLAQRAHFLNPCRETLEAWIAASNERIAHMQNDAPHIFHIATVSDETFEREAING